MAIVPNINKLSAAALLLCMLGTLIQATPAPLVRPARGGKNATRKFVAPAHGIRLEDIWIEDFSVNNFVDFDENDPEFKGLSISCSVGYLSGMFDSNFLADMGIYPATPGAAVSCPVKLTAPLVGTIFSGRLSAGVAACPPSIVYYLDSPVYSGGDIIEPSYSRSVGPAELSFDLNADSSGNFLLHMELSVSFAGFDASLEKEVHLGFSCDDVVDVAEDLGDFAEDSYDYLTEYK